MTSPTITSSTRAHPPATLWTGPTITFINTSAEDPARDTLTDRVALDRGNAGTIFNAAVEVSKGKNSLGPAGIRWAVGSIRDGIGNLDFSASGTVDPGNGSSFLSNVCQGACGEALPSTTSFVAHLIAENIYVDFIFTAWGRGDGAFAYRRSTPAPVAIPLRAGTPGNDILVGTSGNDQLRGLGGDDRLLGLAGNDQLIGGNGNDFLRGSGGRDRLLGQAGRDVLVGDDGNDVLIGGLGNDRLVGGVGNDVLIGGQGTDILLGGSGRDRFMFNTFDANRDIIVDFRTEDIIDLRQLLGGPQFNGRTAAEKFTQFVLLVQRGSHTDVRIDQNGNGPGTAYTLLATLQNVSASSLNAADFVII